MQIKSIQRPQTRKEICTRIERTKKEIKLVRDLSKDKNLRD